MVRLLLSAAISDRPPNALHHAFLLAMCHDYHDTSEQIYLRRREPRNYFLKQPMSELDRHGFCILPGLLSQAELERYQSHTDQQRIQSAGTRTILQHAWAGELAQYLKTRLMAQGLLTANQVAIQCNYFEKSSERNWLVAMHQDLSIPVKERIEHASLGIWSRKEEGWYVQPPLEILESLTAVRVHLDDCTMAHGPLRVIPGSHRVGKLSPDQISAYVTASEELPCLVHSGSAVLMKPLLLHASSKATAPNRRRVLHFVFGPEVLPFGLAWQDHTVFDGTATAGWAERKDATHDH
ncbi:phytanoyl-CoA dioxygenase family protein [Andreprevotia chitinilytica]|uniref:phytanoyl-CoA dioxygenase family protein n=1 Tax=Andreprevotia chitinilytica TaxID=396808 RepID=UPI000691DC0B|nr:phytanoyl-CoA dioxygenase family protein [Andreprevotia chitinilytica]